MVDLHSHIIFGVDDGPSTIEQSAEMVYAAEKVGIGAIFATPHSHDQLFDNERLSDNYQELLYKVRNCSVVLKLGYEVFLNPAAPGPAKKNTIPSLDNSRYLLFELPFNVSPKAGFEILHAFRQRDILPILAHPERNRNFLKDPGALACYIHAGCMIQMDAASILGVYGREVRDYARKALKRNEVEFVASNAHSAGDYSSRYVSAFRDVVRWTGEEQAHRLFHGNAQGILNREKQMHAI